MSSLEQHEHLFDLVHDSVMTRTVDGRIDFWNHSAEELYGWRKEDAIGRVSHTLLQTQFPKPLEEIERELVQSGRWEGKLVHTTRDGGRVVVDSRWTLGLKRQSGTVVEANMRSTDGQTETQAGADATMTDRKQASNLSERHEHLFDLVHDSVMTRTVDGRIDFWNHSAEELYGWRKEDAIGRVSHTLLQTQFPKPLEEIERELVQSGRWEGKLVHTTRNGGRVVVDSRWTLDFQGQSRIVVEANTRVADSPSPIATEPTLKRGKSKAAERSKLPNKNRLPKLAEVILGAATFLCVVVFLVYAIYGHDVVRGIYEGKFLGIGNWLMSGKAITPLDAYYEHADSLMLLWTLRLITLFLLAVVFLKKPVGALIAGCSMFLFSFFLFCAVDFFPPLVKLLHLDILPFYAFRETNIADDVLAFRRKPFSRSETHNFKGDNYSPVYGVEVPAHHGEDVYDKHGFKNSYTGDYADIVVLGDSYVADGVNEADTLPRRLERNLPGPTVVSLATPGYGPHQYVEVLRRYGIPYKPKYALLGFFEGNDLEDILSYLRWKEGKPGGGTYSGPYDALSASTLLQKYTLALSQTMHYVAKRAWAQLWAGAKLFLDRDAARPPAVSTVHPDIAVLDLGQTKHKVVLPITETNVRSTEEVLRSEESRALRQLLAEFKTLCLKNNIVPIVLYFPTAVHIYSDYSTEESGTRWLKRRNQLIATKENTEIVVRHLSQELGIEFISLTPIFESKAKEGKLLYYPFDSHWNSEGKEVAARFVADILRSKFIAPPRADSGEQQR